MLSRLMLLAPLRRDIKQTFHQVQNIRGLMPKCQFPNQVRHFGGLFPKDQYTPKFPDKLRITILLVNNWELIPIFVVTGFALGICFYSMYWAIYHKVDVVFTSNNRNCLSRTSDLNHPECHKLFTINQEYHPWPEMQCVIDRMKKEEIRKGCC